MIYKFSKIIFLVMLILGIWGCDTVENNSSSKVSGSWLVPESEIFDGGPGKDGIPALTTPNLESVNSTTYLSDEDLVIVIKEGEEVRIYPHPILDWHEIINDKIGDKSFALTYCPLTGSGISWNRILDGEETTFGVSGLLYNTNLIPYDRKTGSNWSQMRLQSINGLLISDFIQTFPIIETTWESAKNISNTAMVVSTNTGFGRNYGRYPYGDYRTNNSSLIFPVSHSDGRLNAKERVLGVFSGTSTKAYRIVDFQLRDAIVDTIGTERFLIYGNNNSNVITAFKLTELFSDLTFAKSSRTFYKYN